MAFWSTLFSSSETAGNIVDAAIATGDKLVYTDEEKAEMKINLKNVHVKILKAYEPFKIAQRFLALIVGIPFVSIHVIGSLALGFDVGTSKNIEYMLQNNIDTLGTPFATILFFYFAGGAAEGFIRAKMRKKEDEV